jgi:RNA polymerase sigma-70 factor (ECF subfamily)
VIGPGFGGTLAGARDGDEHAFAVLWRDLNPAILRYLRLIAPATAEDTAADVWLEVAGAWTGSAATGVSGPGVHRG